MPAQENLDPLRMRPVVLDQPERCRLWAAGKPGGFELESLLARLALFHLISLTLSQAWLNIWLAFWLT